MEAGEVSSSGTPLCQDTAEEQASDGVARKDPTEGDTATPRKIDEAPQTGGNQLALAIRLPAQEDIAYEGAAGGISSPVASDGGPWRVRQDG